MFKSHTFILYVYIYSHLHNKPWKASTPHNMRVFLYFIIVCIICIYIYINIYRLQIKMAFVPNVYLCVFVFYGLLYCLFSTYILLYWGCCVYWFFDVLCVS